MASRKLGRNLSARSDEPLSVPTDSKATGKSFPKTLSQERHHSEDTISCEKNTLDDDKPQQRMGCARALMLLMYDIKWFQVIYNLSLAIGYVYALIRSTMMFVEDPFTFNSLRRVGTWVFGMFSKYFSSATFLTFLGGIGMSAGDHRLWSHRTYKAKLPLRILLMVLSTSIGESSIYYFVKQHRIHHAFVDTHIDPQNIKRGFWFAFIGWKLMKGHVEYRKKKKTFNYEDVLSDPVVMFQKKFFIPLALVFAYIIPALIPYYFWNENLFDSFLIAGVTKSFWGITAHGFLNSVSHMIGERPYSQHVSARENLFMSMMGSGEGAHNFHHTFPYDYSLSEFGRVFNHGRSFIDLMALLDQAYDLKRASPECIARVKNQNAILNDD